LEEDLPIGAEENPEAAADDLELAGRRAIDHVVDRRARIAEIGGEIGPVRGEAGEDETAVILDARHVHHGKTRVLRIEAGALVTAFQRDGQERPVGPIGPAVIAAAEELDVAVAVADDLGAAVTAAIVEDMHGAVAVPAHHHGLAADRRRQIIARLRHLAVVTDIDPGAAEDALHLELEDPRIDIDVAVDAIRLDELADRRSVIRHFYLLAGPRTVGPRPWHSPPLSLS